MAGTNPYIKPAQVKKPGKKYSITFLLPSTKAGIPAGVQSKTVEVDPENIPSGGTGLVGSILDIALGSDVDIDHACGGVVACSTCHIIVKKGLQTCNESTDEEEDQLDKAPALTPQSRLGCQCVPNGNEDLIVEVPNWNRNLVREG
jgi:2Fe-2S ferredoxin